MNRHHPAKPASVYGSPTYLETVRMLAAMFKRAVRGDHARVIGLDPKSPEGQAFTARHVARLKKLWGDWLPKNVLAILEGHA